ncbi:MAG: D-amino-acid transaminase [Rhodospirillaceae bacterium]|nr:D-amino-acid transaminase [Rhodospirillaceae bacterium]
MSHIAYVNGRYLPQAQAFVHIEDRGYQFGDAVYEVTCIWNGRPVDHAGHLQRLRRSLSELRIAMPMSEAAFSAIIREVVRRNRVKKGTVYIQVGRGVSPRNHPFPVKHIRPSVVITAKHGAGPSEAVAQAGVKVAVQPDIRWGRVDIKTVGLLPNALAKQAAVEAKAFEALLVREDGTVTEASASNAWLVTKDKAIITHPATNKILSGITRATVMKLAKQAGYTVQERAFTLDEVYAAKEFFLTGTTTFVMPVVQVGDRPVANGSPGETALRLRQMYIDYVNGLGDEAWSSAVQSP